MAKKYSLRLANNLCLSVVQQNMRVTRRLFAIHYKSALGVFLYLSHKGSKLQKIATKHLQCLEIFEILFSFNYLK